MRINIDRFVLQRFALAYVALPSFVFVATWVRSAVGVPAAILLAWAAFRLMRSMWGGDETGRLTSSCDMLSVSVPCCALFFVAVLAWCVLSGQGGLVPQSYDWHWRNALFRDLLTHEWPVAYPVQDKALVFYLGHWLPPAFLAKVLLASGLDAGKVWAVGKALLLAWTFLGVAIVFLQAIVLVRATGFPKMFMVLAVLAFGDGLDLLGIAVKNVCDLATTGSCGTFWPTSFHWLDGMLYAHHGTLLYWVFHQTVIPWIAVLCLADGFPLRGAALLLSLVLLCGPFPAIGIAVMAAFLAAKEAKACGFDFRRLARLLFSVENFVGALVVLPVVGAYLTANPQSGAFHLAWTGVPPKTFFFRYLLFVLCEAGLYFLVTWRHFRGNVWWWSVLFVLLLCPLVKVGAGWDFSQRVSTPAWLLLLLMTLYAMVEFWKERKAVALSIAFLLVLGAGVPIANMKFLLVDRGRDGLGGGERDAIVSFDRDVAEAAKNLPYPHCKLKDITMNCCCRNPGGRFFYKWLARRHDPEPDGRSAVGREERK